MIVSLIVAVSENGVIGAQGDLPWRLSDDLRRFKALTMGHHLLLGRRTFESIQRPLPGRRVIVLTRNPSYQASDSPIEYIVVHSLDEALELAREAGEEELFIGGGAAIFALALPLTDRIYWTRVHAIVEGDTFFPPFDRLDWALQRAEFLPADERNQYPFTLEILERRRSSAPRAG